MRGFTLIELIILLLVTSILSLGMHTLYAKSMSKIRRRVAAQEILKIRIQFEADKSADQYTRKAWCLKSNSMLANYYIIRCEFKRGAHYEVIAVAQGGQAQLDPDCSQFGINELGKHINYSCKDSLTACNCWR